jgi:hypothetical protein
MFLALRAHPGNFDDGVVDRKADMIGLRQQAGIAIFEFGHLLAITADQKLRSALMARVHTTDECIAAFDAMDQTLHQQKFQRTIDDRRSDTLDVGSPIQFRKYVVGSQGLVACQQNFENLAASRGEAQFARLANLPGCGQQLALTTTMVVFAKCDVGRLIVTRHNVIL